MAGEASHRARRARTLAGGVALLATLVLAPAADATFPGRNGRVAYEKQLSESLPDSSVFVSYETDWIYSFRPGRAGSRRRIAKCQYSSFANGSGCVATMIGYSPNGRRLAYVLTRYTQGSARRWIVLVSTHGERTRRLPASLDTDPLQWGPDGRSFLGFVPHPSSTSSEEHDLALLRLDGSVFRRITTGGAEDGAWSVRGDIAFSSYPRLYLLRKGSRTGREPMVRPPRPSDSPTWSPSGRTVAFVRDHGEDRQYVWLVRRDGTHARPFMRRPADAPTFSPDGRLLVYQRDDASLYVVPLTRRGKPRELVIGNGCLSSEPCITDFDWQPRAGGRRP